MCCAALLMHISARVQVLTCVSLLSISSMCRLFSINVQEMILVTLLICLLTLMYITDANCALTLKSSNFILGSYFLPEHVMLVSFSVCFNY